MKTVIPASYYADAFEFMSDEQTRYYLCGLSIESTGHLAATDGHILFAAHPASGDCAAIFPDSNIIAPRDKSLLKHCRAAKREVSGRYLVIDRPDPASFRATLRVVLAGDPAGATHADATVVFTLETNLIDGTFPEWRKVLPAMPDEPPAAHPAFDARRLAKLGTAARQGKNNVQAFRIIPGADEISPCWVDLGRPDAFAIIMPCRWGDKSLAPMPKLPAWLSPPAKEEKAA